MENLLNALAKPLPMLTLQEWSAIKLATVLSNHQRLLSLILDFQKDANCVFYFKNGKEWKAILSVASELLSEISNSKKIKEQMLEFFSTVTFRIIWFKSTYAPFIEKEFLRHFYWTGRGKLDYIRTGKYILENENISIRNRFKLACSLSIPENVRKLYNELSNDDKIYFQKNNETMRPLLLFWMHVINGCYRFHRELTSDALKCSVSLGFSEATKFLFSALPDDVSDLALICEDKLDEKVNNMRFLEESEIKTGFMFFSCMDDYNQRVVLNFNSGLSLLLLLHSSERELFLQELKNRLSSISLNDIEILLLHLAHNYYLEIKDHDYFELFVEVWRILFAIQRKFMISNLDLGIRILNILIKDEFRYLLKKENSGPHTFSTFYSVTPFCFIEDKWELLYFLIEEGIVTIPSLTSYKSVIFNFLQEKKIPEYLKSSRNIF